MYPINDKEYLRICAEIASLMSISLSSAKKKVEIQVSKRGSQTLEEKRKVAQELLILCQRENENGLNSSKLFDELMESIKDEDNFLLED